MIFGNLKPSLEGIRDIGWRETVIFAPLVALTILFGVVPKPVLDMSAASVAQLLDNYNHAIAAAETAETQSSLSFRIESDRGAVR
jgi:NADH-quinone oxidoreductase subunit M